MVSNLVKQLLAFPLTWEKVDSHVEKKRKLNPAKKFKGNKLAWRLNEKADELAGAQCSKHLLIPEVFFDEATVMVKY